jgi:hypothetical protein
MADAKELLQKRINDERQYAKEHFDVEFRAVGYLLAANAAGLAGCITLLKDYAAVPQLKGIGFFIALFGTGFIFAVIGFIAITVHRQAWLGSFRYDKERAKRPMAYALGAFAPNDLSCLCLCSAVPDDRPILLAVTHYRSRPRGRPGLSVNLGHDEGASFNEMRR